MPRHLLALGTLACLLVFSPFISAAEPVEKTLGILMFDGILTSEVAAPSEVFGKASREKEFADYRVITIAPEKRPIRTAEGLALLPQYSIEDAPPLDVLIVGGANKMDSVLADHRLIAFVRQQGHRVRWLASNCAGASLLGEAGLLVGRRATTYRGGEDAIRKKYGVATVDTNETVVVDDHLVTSNGGLVSYQAALALLERMTSHEFAKRIGDSLYYNLMTSAAGNVGVLPDNATSVKLAAAAGAPAGGNTNGDITIVEFFDYRCPYCRTMAETLAELAAADGHVRIVYRDYPILGPSSLLAAKAALASAAQGKYEPFHRALMKTSGPLNRYSILHIAEGLGIDSSRLIVDMDSHDVNVALDYNHKLATQLGISGTPAFLVGDALIPAAVDAATLKRALAAARKTSQE